MRRKSAEAGPVPRDYSRERPAGPAVLIVEVAVSSSSLERSHKGSLYGDASAPFGWRYASQQTLGPGSSIAPLAVPGSVVVVADLLP